MLFLYPVIESIGPGFTSILLVQLFGMLLYGLYTAIAPAIMVELFPTEVRGVGIGSTYNLVVALLSGTTPYLMTAAGAHQRTGWFIAYVCAGALVSLITFVPMPEPGPKPRLTMQPACARNGSYASAHAGCGTTRRQSPFDRRTARRIAY